MGYGFNAITGQFDLVSASAILDAEVDTWADLPQTVGDPPVGSTFFVKSSTGVWLVNRRSAGIWLRTSNTGVRADDWTYGGDYPVNSVAGKVGNVTLTASDVGAAAAQHAASHAAGRQAIFVGTVAGMTTPVTIQADNAGTAGNSITLSFNGSSDIDTVLAAWNSANPSNLASVVFGDTAQVPNNGTSITLSQGTAAGSDAISAPHFTNFSVGDGKTINLGPNYGQFTSASGNAGFSINRGNDSGYASIDLLQFADAGTGWSLQMQPSSNDLQIVNRAVGSTQLLLPASGTTAIKTEGNIEIADTDNGTTGTLVAHTNLTASRTYDLPDASGTLALTSDIPALGTGAGEAAEGNHSHELTSLAATGATNGHVLTANGSGGVTFAAASGGGVTGAASSASDVLGVSGANITGVDANADRIVFWDDSASALKYLEAGSGLSISGTTMTVTATGGATNLWIPASAWIPRTTNGCGVDSVEIGSTNRVNLDQALFDTGAEEFAQALVVMPSNYNNSTIAARFYWTASSGSGGVAWGISGRAYGDDDAIDQASGTRVVVTDTFITANDVHVTSATSAVTIAGTPAANKAVNFQIVREVGNASDTLGVDARLLGVEIIFN